MNDIDKFLKSVSSGLKAFSQAVEVIAEKLDILAEVDEGTKTDTKFRDKTDKTTDDIKETPKSEKPKIRRKTGAKRGRKSKRIKSSQLVFNTIMESEDGISINELQKMTGLGKNNIHTIVYRLKKQGKITTKKRGVYIKT